MAMWAIYWLAWTLGFRPRWFRRHLVSLYRRHIVTPFAHLDGDIR